MMEHRNSSRGNIVLVTGNKDHKVLADKGRDGSSVRHGGTPAGDRLGELCYKTQSKDWEISC